MYGPGHFSNTLDGLDFPFGFRILEVRLNIHNCLIVNFYSACAKLSLIVNMDWNEMLTNKLSKFYEMFATGLSMSVSGFPFQLSCL